MRISDWSSDVCSSDLVEAAAAALDVIAQPAAAAGPFDGFVQRGDGVRVFRAHIDVPVGGPHGQAGDRHAFDQHVGIRSAERRVGEECVGPGESRWWPSTQNETYKITDTSTISQ